jgi:hypothetical protein
MATNAVKETRFGQELCVPFARLAWKIRKAM